MKRIIFLLSSVLMMAVLLITPGARAESISEILGRYNTCDGNYNYDMTHSPDSLAGDCRFSYFPIQCFLAPDEEACVESYRAACIQSAGSNYVSCVGAIGPHRDQINFCAHANEIKNQCIALYSGLEDFEAFAACMDSSGIYQCE